MTQRIEDGAKTYDSDTIPGDFGELARLAPSALAPSKETYKKFHRQSCDFALWKIVAGRQFPSRRNRRAADAAPSSLPAERLSQQVGPSVQRAGPAQRRKCPRIRFWSGQRAAMRGRPKRSISTQRARACPECAARVFEHGMAYVCERAVGPAKGCDFRSGNHLEQTVDLYTWLAVRVLVGPISFGTLSLPARVASSLPFSCAEPTGRSVSSLRSANPRPAPGPRRLRQRRPVLVKRRRIQLQLRRQQRRRVAGKLPGSTSVQASQQTVGGRLVSRGTTRARHGHRRPS